MNFVMETLKISLPSALKSFVDEQLANGSHKSPSAYFAALVRAERKRRAEEKLLELINQAEQSGPATPMTAQDWKNVRSQALARLAKERRPHGKNRQKTSGVK
jgi:antitoxin ParD1/3/4